MSFSIEDYPHNNEKRTDTDGFIVKKARQLDRLLSRVHDIVAEIDTSSHPNQEQISEVLHENEIPPAAWATHCVATELSHPERWETGNWGIRYKAGK
jgi:hypothetical protein